MMRLLKGNHKNIKMCDLNKHLFSFYYGQWNLIYIYLYSILHSLTTVEKKPKTKRKKNF